MGISVKPAINIKAIADGDVKAFETLYLEYYNKVLTFTSVLLQSPVKAEDATQDVFLKLWRNRQNLKEEGNINSYIYMTARRVVLDIFRDEKYAQRHKESIESEFDGETVEESCLKEIEFIATRVVDCMPPRRKEIFLMSRLKGYSAKEIADKLDLSVHTVNKHITLALSMLKEKLSDFVSLILILLILNLQ